MPLRLFPFPTVALIFFLTGFTVLHSLPSIAHSQTLSIDSFVSIHVIYFGHFIYSSAFFGSGSGAAKKLEKKETARIGIVGRDTALVLHAGRLEGVKAALLDIARSDVAARDDVFVGEGELNDVEVESGLGEDLEDGIDELRDVGVDEDESEPQ